MLKLDLNLLWTVVDVLILYVLLRKFLFKPIQNVLEVAIRPTSLCMRLFGNVLGAFVIMELIKLVVPVFVPAIFSLYFDLFDGLIQTYVFVFLTSLFMKETMGDEE